jgi:hypothetical protein
VIVLGTLCRAGRLDKRLPRERHLETIHCKSPRRRQLGLAGDMFESAGRQYGGH